MVGVFSKGKSCRALGQWLKYPRDLKLKGFFFFLTLFYGVIGLTSKLVVLLESSC